MTKSYKKKSVNGSKKSKTMRRVSSSSENSSSLIAFQKKVTCIFFEFLLMIKLFHWKTHSYATHKSTDDLYSKFNDHIDTFIEVLLGKTGVRIDLINVKSIALYDLNDKDELIKKVDSFKTFLIGLSNNKALSSMSNTDLFNIRDEILGDMNQFLYLLSFK